MAESASGQDEGKPVFSLATRTGKMGPSCLTKPVLSRWLDVGLVFLVCVFLLTSTSSQLRKIRKKKNLANI